MWRENFGKKLLDDRLRGRFVDDVAKKKEKKRKFKLKVNFSTVNSIYCCFSEENVDEQLSTHSKRQRHDSSKEDQQSSRHSRSGNEDRHKLSHRRHRDDRGHESNRQSTSQKEKSPPKKSYREAEREERKRRMAAVRQILKQRNGKKQIEAAKERYLKRREAGLIAPVR